jgi:putative beta-barrel porin MtrB/PioB
MNRNSYLLILLASLLVLPFPLFAQGTYEAPPISFGNFNTQGSASMGYRFTDVSGYRPMYMSMMNLRSGPRLMDFSLLGSAKEGANTFADNYSLTASGLGGDPFPTAQVTVSKHKLFDFRASWRQAYYFWNQNDTAILPITTVAAGLSKGLTDNHNWDTVRKFGSADLTLHATDHLRLNVDYYRTTESGTTFTTASPDFLTSPSYWGSYARANPFYLFAPINDETNRLTGGVDYTYHSWSLHYVAGYQATSVNQTLNNISSAQLSIDPAKTSTLEPLSSFTWSNFRHLSTPVSEFSFLGKPLKHLEWRGSYFFYRYRGPASFDQSFSGTGPTATSGVLAPFSVSQSGRDTLTEPDHILSQGFTYDVTDWWSISADYRYSHLTSTGIGSFSSLFNGTTPAAGATNIEWHNNLSDLNVQMDFTPIGTLILRPGVRFTKLNVEAIDGGTIDANVTRTINTVRPELSFGYDPSKKFSFRGDIHSLNDGSPYTAMNPHTEAGGHGVIQFRPFARLSIDNDLIVSNGKFLTTRFENHVRANTTTASYALNERFSIFAGFTYETLFAQGYILYIRGTAPLNDFLHDQEINRVWQGGIDAKPTRRLGVRFSGNFDSSSGVGRISGEPPAYGPVRWPLATGTLYYNFPQIGRLSLDLQRTYYVQQIVTGNNFAANLLTIRWSRDF